MVGGREIEPPTPAVRIHRSDYYQSWLIRFGLYMTVQDWTMILWISNSEASARGIALERLNLHQQETWLHGANEQAPFESWQEFDYSFAGNIQLIMMRQRHVWNDPIKKLERSIIVLKSFHEMTVTIPSRSRPYLTAFRSCASESALKSAQCARPWVGDLLPPKPLPSLSRSR